MAVEVKEVLNFFVPLTAQLWKRNYVYLPESVMEILICKLPRKVFLHCPNGDIFECLFDKEEACLLGLGKMLERYNLSSYHFLFFEYLGGGGFVVSALAASSVEIEYPIECNFFDSVFETFDMVAPRATISRPRGLSIKDDVNASLLDYNCNNSGELELEIMFDSSMMLEKDVQHMIDDVNNNICEDWTDEMELQLSLCERTWNVKVKKNGSRCYLCRGWSMLIEDLEISVGDLCVLSQTKENNTFRVALFRNYISCCRRVGVKGFHTPNKFLKFIRHSILESAKFVVPRLFANIYCADMPQELTFICGGSIFFYGIFSPTENSISGLHEMFSSMHASTEDVYLFTYEGKGVFVVYHFDNRRRQLNRCSQKRDTAYGFWLNSE